MNGMLIFLFSSLVVLLSFLTGEAGCEESAIRLSEMLRDVAVTELGSTPPSHFRCFRSAASLRMSVLDSLDDGFGAWYSCWGGSPVWS